MRPCRTEPTRVLLAIVLSATAACQADSISAPQIDRIAPRFTAAVSATAAVTLHVGDSAQLNHPFQLAFVALPGASLKWQASDSSVVEITGTGVARALMPGDATVAATLCMRPLPGVGARKPGTAFQCQTHTTVVRVESAAVIDSSTTAMPEIAQAQLRKGADGVKWLAGPLPPLATGRGSGWSLGRLNTNDLDKYERAFAKYSDKHWSSHGANWEQANYYDRAAIYYVWWARTGNEKYLARANEIALNYRSQYIEKTAMPYTYNSSSYWHMPLGLALHYLVTGDEKSRTAVGYSAEWVGAQHIVNTIGAKKTMRLPANARQQSPIGASLSDPITVGDSENRTRARILQGFVLAHAINAPMNGTANGYGKGGVVTVVPGTWAQKAKTVLDLILAFQSEDGAYRDEQSGGAEKPFMDGLLNDAMIMYYRFVSPDPRIVSSIKRNLDYNWNNTWLGESFAYYEWSYTSPVDATWAGGRYAAGDLNGLMVGAFGWLYAVTKDVTYRDRGDEVFRHIADSYLDGSKHFNQSFSSSYRYLAYRAGQLE